MGTADVKKDNSPVSFFLTPTAQFPCKLNRFITPLFRPDELYYWGLLSFIHLLCCLCKVERDYLCLNINHRRRFHLASNPNGASSLRSRFHLNSRIASGDSNHSTHRSGKNSLP